MPEQKIDSAVASSPSVFKDFSVASQTTDGPDGTTMWFDPRWKEYLGYYKDEKTPEILVLIG